MASTTIIGATVTGFGCLLNAPWIVLGGLAYAGAGVRRGDDAMQTVGWVVVCAGAGLAATGVCVLVWSIWRKYR